ncbi:MAG: hypothetical protein M0R39_08235 [Prolixibacteraceae bacterium]|jgi:hypothetical protein|nr:hypothetical protein [Prolixibacteraceae bacterium]
MKKLALVLSFVFCAAMIAPAFAADPVKPAAKTECTKDGKACSKECKKACCGDKAAGAKEKKAEVKK